MKTIRETLGLAENVNLKAHRTYRIWYAMRSRVLKPWHHANERYKTLGVYICDRWLGKRGFLHFLEDMGHPPSDLHTIERKDNNGPYSRENCVWATREQQAKNRRGLHYFDTPVGKLCLADAARFHGITPAVAYHRFNRGITDPQALFAPAERPFKRRKT
jgi:hypothetical protein